MKQQGNQTKRPRQRWTDIIKNDLDIGMNTEEWKEYVVVNETQKPIKEKKSMGSYNNY